ncbi:MAG: glycosyltransferase family 4 protein [Gemmatimonadaceae bacterium]
MRIAFLNPSGTIGGAERCLLDLLRGIREFEPDWELHVVVSSNGELAGELAKLGVPCTIVQFPSALSQLGDAGSRGWSARMRVAARAALATPSILRYAARISQFLVNYKPEVVHTNGLKMHAIGALAKPAGSVLVWHIHDFTSSRPVMARVLRFLSPRCALCIANSRSVGDDSRATFGSRLSIRTIMNGVDLLSFRPDGVKLDLDGMFGVVRSGSAPVRIGLVATMAPWKGHSVFLRAIALIDRSIPIAAYIIGGPIYATGTEQEKLERLKGIAASLGILDRVFFTGHIQDVPSAMRALDVIVHASTLPEPFGLVIIEAMATGRPVIVSPLGGAAEIVAEGSFALRAEPGDPTSLAHQMTLLALDGQLRQAMGEAGRSEAERKFGSLRLSKEFIQAYATIRPTRS